MSEESRRELAKSIGPEYKKARLKEKSRLLDNFVLATGYNRKYAVKLLRRDPDARPKTHRTSCHPDAKGQGLHKIMRSREVLQANLLTPKTRPKFQRIG